MARTNGISLLVDDIAKKLMRIYISNFEIPRHWYFKPIFFGDQLMIDTNFDFYKMQQIVSEQNIYNITLSPAFIINHIHNAVADLNLFIRYGSDISVSPASELVFRTKLRAAINNKRHSAISEIELFEHYTLRNSRAIREAVNAGTKSFKEIIDLIEEAERFRGWIKGVHPEKGLVEEYVQ